jgi:hypothetical protein
MLVENTENTWSFRNHMIMKSQVGGLWYVPGRVTNFSRRQTREEGRVNEGCIVDLRKMDA